MRNKDEILQKLEGLHTIETAMKTLGMKRQSTLNLVSKLKKEQYVTTSGGGKRKRLYKITMRKQRPRDPGMFDIINKYSPHMKLAEWYDHQVHGVYGPEEALIDAIETQSFRVILASLHLFRHIKDWKKLYKLANERNCWNKVGALYDVARLIVDKITHHLFKSKKYRKTYLIKDYPTHEKRFIPIEKRWGVTIPFSMADFDKVIG
ncbi:MAG TPA: hypothetical protein VJK72_00985 [Candidatus Nanoarchaeia archaeon]|nr:hypothetical protein [Candidatus Nanoarchaeia archaeon]